MSEAARWPRVKEIFDAAVACRVEDRPALVRDLCGDDCALQTDVESLLAADAGHGSLFDSSVDRALPGRILSAVTGVFDDRSLALTPGERLATYEISSASSSCTGNEAGIGLRPNDRFSGRSS